MSICTFQRVNTADTLGAKQSYMFQPLKTVPMEDMGLLGIPHVDPGGERLLQSLHVTSIGCASADTIVQEILATHARFSPKGKTLAYSLTHHTAKEKDVSAEKWHEISCSLVRSALPDHEALVCTHTDGKKVHSHILVNSVSYLDGTAPVFTRQDEEHTASHRSDPLPYIQEHADRILEEYGLDPMQYVPRTHMDQPWAKRQLPIYRLETMNVAIRSAAAGARNVREMLGNLEAAGYEIDYTDEGVKLRRLKGHWRNLVDFYSTAELEIMTETSAMAAVLAEANEELLREYQQIDSELAAGEIGPVAAGVRKLQAQVRTLGWTETDAAWHIADDARRFEAQLRCIERYGIRTDEDLCKVRADMGEERKKCTKRKQEAERRLKQDPMDHEARQDRILALDRRKALACDAKLLRSVYRNRVRECEHANEPEHRADRSAAQNEHTEER